MMIDVPTVAIQFFIAAVFAEALHHKLNAPLRFAATFGAYRIVPEATTQLAARMILLLEGVVVLTCAFTLQPGLWLAAFLLLAYAAGMGINRARGRSFIDCGCGDEPVPISVSLIVRNGVLALMALMGTSVVNTSVTGWGTDWGTLLSQVAAAAAGFGLYRITNQLIANATKFRLAGYTA